VYVATPSEFVVAVAMVALLAVLSMKYIVSPATGVDKLAVKVTHSEIVIVDWLSCNDETVFKLLTTGGACMQSVAEFEVLHKAETDNVAVASLRLSFLWALIVWLPSVALSGTL